jgi:signal transduction histidine kinase/Tfp pilus assembly protein PilF
VKGNYPVVIWYVLLLLTLPFGVKAQRYNSDSLLQITTAGDDKDKLAAFQLLAQTFRNNNPELAISYIGQAIALAKTINDDAALAKSLLVMASLEYGRGNFNSAKDNYSEAMVLYNQAGNNKMIADITSSLAGIFYVQGNLPLASDHYLKALRIYEDLHDKAGMVGIFSSLGTVYARQNNFSKSIEYNLKAIALYEESSDKFSTLMGYENIGNTYLRQNNPERAKYYFAKSLAIYREIKNNTGVASTLFQLGNIEQRTDQHDRALMYYKRSLEMSEQLRMQPLIVSNLNAMAASYTHLRLYDNAIRYYKQAIEMAKKIDSKIELEEAYQGLAQVYEATKETEKATTFNTLSKELKDSLYNDSNLKKLTELSLTYDSEKKEQQIRLLNKEQQIREIELLREKQTSNILTVAATILGFLFIILVIFSIQNRRIAKSLRKQQTELMEKNRSILEQKEKLDQLNTVKDRFFSIISHDLRNNLTTMKLYFDLIGNKDYVPQDTTEITRQISGTVENTIDLLENLLVWASAQIKGVPIHKQKLNVHTLSEENISLLSGIAHQKNISLVNLVEEDITAFADIDMINLVLRNLITNALKFTPEKGTVSILAGIQSNLCVVQVKDNGVGIDQAMLHRLFKQHEHPTTKGTANEKGTGLGLMLCKDFIERNNGTIWVESEKGNGSTFFFTLPLRA